MAGMIIPVAIIMFAVDSLVKRARTPSLIFSAGALLLHGKSPFLCYSMLLSLLSPKVNKIMQLQELEAGIRVFDCWFVFLF